MQKPRPMIQFVQKRFGDKPLLGAEIGVKAGKNACSMLIELNMKRLYLIDSWEGKTGRYYEHTAKRFAYYHNVEILKMTSEHAAMKKWGELLDFVYIDANHTYEFVKQDIELWYPKIKEGGVLGGHDWHSKKREGLRKAVMEFCHKHLYHLHAGFSHRTAGGDWWIVKGDKIVGCD